jgi:hypothetical protein
MSRYGEKCNVTSCKESHDDIEHNFSGLKYCFFCARKINDYNPEEPIFSPEEIERGREARRQKIDSY